MAELIICLILLNIVKTKEALVAVGGKASRLQSSESYTPIAKSFLIAGGKPLLYWCLQALSLAGIEKVVLAADRKDCADRADQVISELPLAFDEVLYFQDAGLGFHGLPYWAKHLLGDKFFFESGHAINKPEHYEGMDRIKTADNIIFSAFASDPSNRRLPVGLNGNQVITGNGQDTGIALASPLLLDQAYAEALPSLGFDFRTIVGHYLETDKLRAVWSDMPPEFDTPDEHRHALGVYSTYLASNGVLPDDMRQVKPR